MTNNNSPPSEVAQPADAAPGSKLDAGPALDESLQDGAMPLGEGDGAETPQIGRPEPDAAKILEAVEVLEQLVDDRGLLTQLTRAERSRLSAAAGRVALPTKRARKQFTRAARVKRKQEDEAADQQLLAETGIRRTDSVRIETGAPPRPFPEKLPPPAEIQQERFRGKLKQNRNCYVCKRDFDRLHVFYDSLCPDCAEFNWDKRNQTSDLRGRFALLTGGRVKIGFFAGLKLLRAGAELIVTTRFPVDAAKRFMAEEDAASFQDRLHIHGLDLRHLPSVERFADHLTATLPHLDFVLNNACQTVRRPPGYYGHLMEGERQPISALPQPEQQLLDRHRSLVDGPLLEAKSDPNALAESLVDSLSGLRDSALRTQAALLPQDVVNENEIFPTGRYDEDSQQVDQRTINSWRLKLADVSTLELVEVQLVNASAPFILNSKLKPLMERNSQQDRHIVNVSAMEGVFYRAFKRDTHPHTNMAKAALNMLTRTSAQDYVKTGIHMNSVDTGWITDEDPQEIAERKRREHDFHPPLDHVDAAARICDPIFSGLNSGTHVWGKFLKDYQVSNW